MKKQYCPYCMNPVEEGEVCQNCGLTAGNYEPSQNHLPPGTMLENRYLIGRVLGEGGFGITYIGCDTKLEMKVAIKEYYPAEKVQRISTVSLDLSVPSAQARAFFDAGKQRFLQEALIMAQMDKQPEIVGVRDFFECNNTAYIVMEFVEGTTFKQLVEQRGSGIPAAELLPLVRPLFGALSNFHEKGLIHRDISPDNLMLERGAVRLLDFGCARQPERGDTTMTIVLKHGYAPIEQYTNRGQGPWTDVYALGATLYFCLVGKRPPQAMDRAVEDELILPRKLGVELTEEQEQALMKAIGVKRSQRFASMEEFHAALYRAPQPQEAVRLQLNVRNILKNGEDRSGFSYELVDDDGKVLKTASTDPHGQAKFVLTFGPETAGYTYTYTIRQVDLQRPDVVAGTESYTLSILIRIRSGKLCAEVQMNGMPVSEEQVFVFHNVLRKAPAKRKQPQKNWPAWAEPALVLGAAVAIVAAIALPPLLSKDPAEEPQTSAVQEQIQAEEQAGFDAMFAEAAVFTGELSEELLDHLTNQTQPVVVKDGQFHLDANRIGQIRAPLLIEESATVYIADPMVLEASVVVRGTLELFAPMTVRESGTLYLQRDGIFQGDGLVLLEDWQGGVSGQRQSSMDAGIRYVSFVDGAIPEDAVFVTTEEELRTVSHSGVLVVSGDLVLTQDLNINHTLIVAEGASLTGPLEEGQARLHLGQEGKLLNYGTVSCGLSSDSSHYSTFQNFIYNAGDLSGRLYMQNNTYILNRGTMQWNGVQLFDKTRLYNEGRMEVPTNQWGTILEGALVCNFGELTICGNLDNCSSLRNRGNLTLADGGSIQNLGYLLDQGTFRQSAQARLRNCAIIELSGTMIREKEAEIQNTGVFQINDWGQANLQLSEELPGKVIHMIDAWDEENTMEVTDAAGFYAALDDGAVGAISVTGPVVLDQPVVLWKNVCVQTGGSLTTENQLETKAVLHNYGEIRVQNLRVTEHGQITNSGTITVSDNVNTASGSGILNYGTIQSDKGILTFNDTAVMNYGTIRDFGTLNLVMGTVMAQSGDLQVSNSQILLKQSVLVEMGGGRQYDFAEIHLEQNSQLQVCRSMFWRSLQIHVDETSKLATWYVTVEQEEQTTIENYGLLQNIGYYEHVFRVIGELNNYGTVLIQCPMELLGAIHNQGVVETFEAELLRMEGGTLTGNPLRVGS